MARILGLSTSAGVVRAVVLRSSFKALEVERYLEVPMDGGRSSAPSSPRVSLSGVTVPPTSAPPSVGNDAAVEPGATGETQPSPLQAALMHLATLVGAAPDRIVVSLPGTEASLRILEVPAGAAKRVQEVLPFELEASLPFPVEDSIIDHQPLGKNASTLSVLACAVPRQRVSERVGDYHGAMVHPREMAVGAAALDGLIHLVPELGDGGVTMLLEVESDHADICILEAGEVRFVRSLSMGSGDGEALRDEVNRTLAGFRARAGLAVEGIFVLGGGGEDPQLIDWLGQTLNIPCAPLPLPATADGIPAGPLGRFGRAAALAARARSPGRRINLMQGEFAPKRALGALRRYLPVMAASAAAVLLTFLLSLWSQYLLMSDTKAVLEEQLEAVTASSFGQGVSSSEEARALLAGAGLANDPLPEFDAYDLIDMLTESIPSTVTHDIKRLAFNLEEDGKGARFELHGTIPSVQDLEALIASLKTYDCSFCTGDSRTCIPEIENRGTTAGSGGVGQNYQVEGQMRCPGSEPPSRNRRGRRRDP